MCLVFDRNRQEQKKKEAKKLKKTSFFPLIFSVFALLRFFDCFAQKIQKCCWLLVRLLDDSNHKEAQ
jgi:hypothetical protein